ncbi:hypothetical protein V6N13_139206 [Hibiscus sabdariffa]|uniref:Uncharacterized protein n=1 Tax=Hibiscus sabdariffa TaxID=183260 RepID=A0ABR2PL32_9ROSI
MNSPALHSITFLCCSGTNAYQKSRFKRIIYTPGFPGQKQMPSVNCTTSPDDSMTTPIPIPLIGVEIQTGTRNKGALECYKVLSL